jgi:exonuclease SbcC
MAPRLDTLIVENFRSIKGKIVVPLNAQVVLVHGTNGMGKSSIMSALEIGLTGRMAHLAANGDGYQSYLTHLGEAGGAISLSTTEPLAAGQKTMGEAEFTEAVFKADPLLASGLDRFFAERCYLPQATLGRLLEIYSSQTATTTSSPLTQFVKEILGLDPLDALVDGLYPAFNVARVRNLVPEYRRLEALDASTSQGVSDADASLEAARSRSETARAEAAQILEQLGRAADPVTSMSEIEALLADLESSRAESDALVSLERLRAELKSVSQTWRGLASTDVQRDLAGREQTLQSLTVQLEQWRQDAGARLAAVLALATTHFPDLPGLDDGPTSARASALARAEGEAERCDNLIAAASDAADRGDALQQMIARSNVRLEELDAALSSSVDNTRSLASALAGLAPHIHSDICPVCDRDFADQDAGPLAAHLAGKIAALTTEAGRLQALAVERAETTNRLTQAQRELLTVDQRRLEAEALAALTNRATQMSGMVEQLRRMEPDAEIGADLLDRVAAAREAATAARRANETSASVRPELEKIVELTLSAPLGEFPSVDEALSQASAALDSQISFAQGQITRRVQAMGHLETLKRTLLEIDKSEAERTAARAESQRVKAGLVAVGEVRESAKSVSEAAQKVRAAIVKKVFNTALNKSWRDLFVRLAPSEDFVPAFKIPEGEKDKVEAVLETVHRSGRASGTPSAMLSQGNLNTAALTLFLALHLSVPARTPWLVLDDPVQSMDDVHIAQFAALLRTLSKGVGRQVIVAVHERALFDYLTLELSPAYPGDSLITIEVTRNFDGETVATPRSHKYEADQLDAA